MKKRTKKILTIFLCILLFSYPSVHADEEEDENVDVTQLWEVVQTSNARVQTEPLINSRSAIVMEPETGEILYEKNSQQKRPMASTIKIMTAILVIENGNLKDVVTVSKKAAGTGGSTMGLKEGDKILLRDLLYGLMLRSGNDAAIQIAEYMAGSVEEFAKQMNQKAEKLHLTQTHFVTPHGLDQPEHYTTAYELAQLARYALQNEQFAHIVNSKNITIQINGKPKELRNTNELLGALEGVNGVKTGFTNGAGRCLVTSVNRNGKRLITVVLGADTKKNRTRDSIVLIEYAYQKYQWVDLGERMKEAFLQWKQEHTIEVKKGIKENLKEMTAPITTVFYPIAKEEIKNLKTVIAIPETLQAPVQKQEKIGEILLEGSGKIKERMPIYAEESIARKDVGYYWKDLWCHMTKYMEEYIR